MYYNNGVIHNQTKKFRKGMLKIMEIILKVTHVDDVGDKPVELKMNDVNKTDTVNLYLNGQHYRVNLDELERAIKAIK